MVIFRIAVLVLLAVGCQTLSAEQGQGDTPAPQLRVSLQPPAAFYTHNLGANGAGQMRFAVRLMNSVTAQPPITVRTTLPDGITFDSFANSGWDCSAVGQELTCNYLLALSSSSPERNVRIRTNVAGDIPVPGVSTIRLLREHATLPPPDPLDCDAEASAGWVHSETGCVEWDVPNLESSIWFETSGWNHSPAVFMAGSTENLIETTVRSVGFHSAHQPVHAVFLLPTGFLFNRAGPNGTWSCTADTPTPDGQWVDCLYTLGSYNITTGPWLRVDMAHDVPVPGPHTILAHVGNEYQRPPDDLQECLDPEPLTGCSSHTIGTGTPPRARMEIVEMSHQPAAFVPRGQGQLHVQYTNVGEATAGALALELAAPPGFTFDQVVSSTPLMSCSASGDPAAGQSLSCSAPSGLGVGQLGQVWLNFQVDWAGEWNLPVTASIGDSTRPGPSLDACEVDTEQSGCGQHSIPLRDGLFCDRFEHPTGGCRPLD